MDLSHWYFSLVYKKFNLRLQKKIYQYKLNQINRMLIELSLKDLQIKFQYDNTEKIYYIDCNGMENCILIICNQKIIISCLYPDFEIPESGLQNARQWCKDWNRRHVEQKIYISPNKKYFISEFTTDIYNVTESRIMKDSVLKPCFSALFEFQHEIVKFMTDKDIVLSGQP